MPPSQPMSYLYCDEDDIDFWLAESGHESRLDDDGTGALSTDESAYRTKAIRWATGRCNQFLLGSHAASDLAESWTVNHWASIIAAYIVSCRRGNPAAGSLKDWYDETMADLKAVKSGEQALTDTAMRDSAFPGWSNLSTSDLHYRLKRVRVQRPISSRRGTPVNRVIDHRADVVGGYES